MTATTTVPAIAGASVPATVAELAAGAADYANAAKAPNTRRGYQSDWRSSEAWCGVRGLAAMSQPETAALAARFAGHSLRAGLATSAAAHDAPGHAIQRQLRHRSFAQTAGYIRDGRLFKNNAAGSAGL